MAPKRQLKKQKLEKKPNGKPIVKNALWVWDMTWNNPTDTPRELQDKLMTICKKWVFQREVGKEGTMHYQIRLSLKDKSREASIISQLHEMGIMAHATPTSLKTVSVQEGKGFTVKFDYVMKSDTRTEGPWSDKEPIIDMPREILGRTKREWQKVIYDEIKTMQEDGPKEAWFDRRVFVIVDPVGAGGKTTLQKFVGWDKLGCMVPPFEKPEDTLAACMELKSNKCFMVNLPRGYSTKDEKTFWAGMESLKDGYLYDKRFNFRSVQISSPIVYVFSNRAPMGQMSKDRFHIRLLHGGKLYQWSEGRYKALVQLSEDIAKHEQAIVNKPTDEFDLTAMYEAAGLKTNK